MERGNGNPSIDGAFVTPNERPNVFDLGIVPSRNPLPIEIAQIILSHASDARSLRALVLSTSLFYRAFLANRRLIIQDVLHNEFRPSILPYALATLVSSHYSPQPEPHVGVLLDKLLSSQREAVDFTREFWSLPDSLPRKNSTEQATEVWSLSDLFDLSRTHEDVGYFARDFASNTEVLKEPTPSENDRIEQAFYKYQLFCNLFRKREGRRYSLGGSRDHRKLFLDKFSPWENEQLASIYEHLFGKVSIVFDDVASHDVEWGANKIPYLDDFNEIDVVWKEHHLSLGLRWLRHLVTAKTYEERYHLLEPELSILDSFFFCALREPGDNPDTPLSALTEEEQRQYISPPATDDNDNGPQLAWRWAYQDESVEYLYFQHVLRTLRKHGYVFFDYDRLRDWDVYQQPSAQVMDEDIEGSLRHHNEMRESWRARSQIWGHGGRGWWSEGDQSRLVWPNGGTFG